MGDLKKSLSEIVSISCIVVGLIVFANCERVNDHEHIEKTNSVPPSYQVTNDLHIGASTRTYCASMIS